MKFDYEKIGEELRVFWRENKKKMHFFLGGKEIYPESVSSCTFQLNEVESSGGYNFEVTTLNLRVQIDSMEAPYQAFFLIKVASETTSDNDPPKEKIISIQNNRIILRK